MLSKEENELLTRVGPGTPCGEMMRRYWHPIAAAVQLDDNPVRKVRILSEDLVLYRDRSGQLGLIGERCIHRAVHMEWGIPEENGLRCPYHGWLYNESGQCTEMPLEPPESTFKNKITLKSYPVQEMGGLIWAYLGPQPAPLLPRWDLFVRPDGFRQAVGHWLPCNWLQAMENRGDLGHGTYLHGRLFQYVLEKQGRLTDDPASFYNVSMRQQTDRQQRGAYIKYWPIYNEHGFAKGRLETDGSEIAMPPSQKGTNPIIFPYILSSGQGSGSIRQSYHFAVPIDDTTSWHVQYFCYLFPEGVEVPKQDKVPYADVPLKDEQGEYIMDYVLAQDMVAWYSQDLVTDRTKEHLATSDACVIAYRRMLREQIERVMEGGDPMNTFRDPAKNDRLMNMDVPETRRNAPGTPSVRAREYYHKMSKGGWRYIDDDTDRYCPDRDLLIELFTKADEVLSQKAPAG